VNENVVRSGAQERKGKMTVTYKQHEGVQLVIQARTRLLYMFADQSEKGFLKGFIVYEWYHQGLRCWVQSEA
jgi:hypothetical protein